MEIGGGMSVSRTMFHPTSWEAPVETLGCQKKGTRKKAPWRLQGIHKLFISDGQDRDKTLPFP